MIFFLLEGINVIRVPQIHLIEPKNEYSLIIINNVIIILGLPSVDGLISDQLTDFFLVQWH